MSDIGISIANFIAEVEIQRPPNNFFDTELINDLADAFESFDERDDVRAIVLCAAGKHFCAGNDFSKRDPGGRSAGTTNPLYAAATRLFNAKTPVVGGICHWTCGRIDQR
jgi:enoyl-CoA hydratase/carnithine racemase